MYIDGDDEFPTICGTGLEDYVGTAWGMGEHQSLYGGVPFELKHPDSESRNPDYTGFYRWHVLDPVVFEQDLKVTVQQIGSIFVTEEDKESFEGIAARNTVAGAGWLMNIGPGIHAFGIAERIDDYCATAFVYCKNPQQVPKLDLSLVIKDIERLSYEIQSEEEKRYESIGAITE